MFAAAYVRDREIAGTFDWLALGFLPRVDRATLVGVAQTLAPCADTLVSVLDFLMRHSPETRGIVIGGPRIFCRRSRAGCLPEGRVGCASRIAALSIM